MVLWIRGFGGSLCTVVVGVCRLEVVVWWAFEDCGFAVFQCILVISWVSWLVWYNIDLGCFRWLGWLGSGCWAFYGIPGWAGVSVFDLVVGGGCGRWLWVWVFRCIVVLSGVSLGFSGCCGVGII